MSAREYITARELSLAHAQDPKTRDLVRAYAQQQGLVAWNGILRLIGEAVA